MSAAQPFADLGAAIAERRRAVGKTQEDLAYEAGISLRHLQKIEAGTTNMRLSTLFEVAKVLELKPQKLLDAGEEKRNRKRR